MYIGPWQEYKLAKLIQNQQNQIQALQAGIAPSPTVSSSSRLRLNSGHRRRGSEKAQSERADDDTESTATSSFSTKSAPLLGTPHGRPRNGAQRKLEEYYQDEERERRREDKEIQNRLRPPRPNSGIRVGGKLPSERRDAAVQKKKENFTKVRNSRIHGMRALYGLKCDSRPSSVQKNSDGMSDATPSPTHSQVSASAAHSQSSNSVLSAASAVGGYGRPMLPPLSCEQDQGSQSSSANPNEERKSVLQQKPLWLSHHQSASEKLQTPSTSSRSTAASSACSAAPVAPVRAAKSNRELITAGTRLSPTLEEAFDKIQTSMDFEDDFAESPVGNKCDEMDPLAMSSMSNASNDLINWSKNLRPEDLSPEATLASFFMK